MFWDFLSLRPESVHQTMFLFADRGIPDGYRHMNGYGSHTFKLINKNGEPIYCKFHMKTAQGIKYLDAKKAHELSASDPDYSIRDLYNAIARGDFPQYNMSIQVMTYEQAERYPFNPFDVTKVWSQKDYPLIPVGKLVFDRNPNNYFAEVEQLAFCPGHFVPGIETSPDKMLQGRIFSYSDTHRHRLGANYLQIPVNCPYKAQTKNYQRDGPMNVTDNQGGAPNYFPNSFGGPAESPFVRGIQKPYKVTGDVFRFDSGDDNNFAQATDFWSNVLDDAARKRLVDNLSGHLVNAAPFIQERAVKNFSQVHVDFGKQLTEGLKLKKLAKM